MNRIEEAILRQVLIANLRHHKTTALCTAVGFTCTGAFLFLFDGWPALIMTTCCTCFAVVLFKDFVDTKKNIKDAEEDLE